MCIYIYIYIYTHIRGETGRSFLGPLKRRANFMCGLYCHFNNLRFKKSLNLNDCPIPFSSALLCFKLMFDI